MGKKKAWEFWFTFYGQSLLRVLGIEVKITGQENIKGPAIFAMNHESLLDILLLPAVTPPQKTAIAKKEFDRMLFISFVMRAGQAIFVDRKNTQVAIESLREGLKKLPNDYSILIFPEGTRSTNFKLQPLKKGIVHIAIQSKRPIVTIGYYGMEKIGGGKGTLLFKPSPLYLHANKKIDTMHWKIETVDEHLEEIKESLVLAIEEAKKRSQL